MTSCARLSNWFWYKKRGGKREKSLKVHTSTFGLQNCRWKLLLDNKMCTAQGLNCFLSISSNRNNLLNNTSRYTANVFRSSKLPASQIDSSRSRLRLRNSSLKSHYIIMMRERWIRNTETENSIWKMTWKYGKATRAIACTVNGAPDLGDLIENAVEFNKTFNNVEVLCAGLTETRKPWTVFFERKRCSLPSRLRNFHQNDYTFLLHYQAHILMNTFFKWNWWQSVSETQLRCFAITFESL